MKLTLASLSVFFVLTNAQSPAGYSTVPEQAHKFVSRGLPEEDFQEFLRLQVALLESTRDDQVEIANTLDQHSELINSINSAFVALLGRVITLETEVAALKNTTDSRFSDVDANIGSVNSSVTALGTKLDATDAKVADALNKYQSCVTGIRFGAKEAKMTHKDAGYVDTKPYILTGAENWNSDEFIDAAHRRKIQLQRGGSWVDPEWE